MHLWHFVAQLMVYPPSTTKACPWIKEALPEHKNKTALATSSGVPILRMGAILTAGCMRCLTSSELVVMGVSMTPGQTQLTLMLSSE